MVSNWFFWGIGWLLMPRMTIGIMICYILPDSVLGIVLAIIGAILDLVSKSSKD